MDRFIVQLAGYTTVPYWHLKSNMDRFIDILKDSWEFGSINLKSNMDRFIEFCFYGRWIENKI